MKSTVLHQSDTEPASFLASIIGSSDDAIFGTTLDGRVVSWNKAAEEMYGYSAEMIVGKPAFVLAPEDRVAEIEASLAKIRAGEKIPHYETMRLRKDRSLIHVSIRISAVRNAAGQIAGAAVIARDITERKRIEEALAITSRIKQQFLNNMSHEIRTPLNGILGMTDLVLGSDLNAEQREDLTLVKSSAETLLAAIDEILDFSQIEGGKLKLESISFDFRESIGETMKLLGFRAQKKNLELVYDIDPEIPAELLGDPGRIRRVIYCLVGNAIKFTDRGDILATVRQESRTSDDVTLHFAVRDTGIGIAPELQKVILQPFIQVDGSTTRKYGGTGLGLTIAARLVELMDGKIWLESELGKGSTFHFTVGLKAHDKSHTGVPPFQIEALHDLRILIIDDNAMNRRVLRKMLGQWGMKATDVSGGAAALEALRIAKDIGYPFSLVLLDGQMREMDGFKVAEEIKKDTCITGATIMMLTSVGHVGDAARCRELGIAAYLVKPIRLSELANAICIALDRSVAVEDAPLVTRHFLREAKFRVPPAV